MTKSINTPYVKKYDENGKVLPLENGVYLHFGDNRKKRREILQNKSFTGNHKGMALNVVNNGIVSAKYRRFVQVITDKVTGVKKSINHYLAV